jgi:hypothetical protein
MVSSDVQLWAAVVGFLLPIATAVVIRQGWSSAVQSVANFVLAAIAAAGTQYFEGNLTGDNWRAYVHTLLIVFVASIASYHGFFRPTNIGPKIEAATGGEPAPAAPNAPAI